MRPHPSPRRLRGPIILLIGLAMAALGRPPTAIAADFGAKTSGNWSSSSTWTPTGGPPGASDNAYIGSTYPNGAASTATVLLTQNQQANTVYLGYGAGTSGTLNLGNFNLTANELYHGLNGGTGAIARGTGSLNIGYMQLSASTLALSASDRTTYLFLTNGSSSSTAATANVTDGVRVWSGSTLTLGADLYCGGFWDSYNIEVSGANSTLDAQGYKITTPDLSFGWEYVNNSRVPGSHVVNFLNRGDLHVSTLFVANQNLDLTATDQVTIFALANGSTTFAPGATLYNLQLQDGSTATTTAVGNITGGTTVYSGSTLTLGADLDANLANGVGYVSVAGNNSTLNAQGHRITASGLYLGWEGGSNVRLLNRGDVAVTDLFVGNQNFNLTPTDLVTNFSLSNAGTSLGAGVAIQRLYLQDGATATTSAAGNITHGVEVTAGSTLTLGANLNASEGVQVYGDNSTINAQGHKITADYLRIAVDGGTNVRLLNKGELAITTELMVAGQNFNLTDGDQVARFHLIDGSTNLGAAATVQNLSLQSSTATTSTTGNVTGSVDIFSGSTLTLGADVSVSGSVDVGHNSTLDAQGHKITAHTLALGSRTGGTNTQFLNKGDLDVTNLILAGLNVDLSAADRVANLHVQFGAGGIGSTASTVATANVTGSVSVFASTLTLGADLSVSGTVDVGMDNSTLNAQGHNITADSLSIGWGQGGENVRLLNRGNLAVTNLSMAQDFNLTAADRVTNFRLIYGTTNLAPGVSLQSLGVYDTSTATTSAAGNVTGSVDMANVSEGIGARLTLGADLILSGNINAYGHTVTINAQGRNITASGLSFEYAPGNPGLPNIHLLNDGAITVNGPLSLAGGVQLELRGGNDTARSLFLSEDSGLRIKSAATGFTLTGTSAHDLLFNGTSTLTLELNGLQPGWVFRWANPAGGDHIADLNSLIAQDMILFSATNGGQFNILSQNGYTYIVQPVPEPALILLFAAPIAIGLCRRRWNRSTTPSMAS